MDKLRQNWKRTPGHVRRPTVFIIGWFIILLSGTIGWMPGPGGIPLFLLGVAVLASEFHWAHRVKVFFLSIIHRVGDWYRANKLVGTVVFTLMGAMSLSMMYMLFLS